MDTVELTGVNTVELTGMDTVELTGVETFKAELVCVDGRCWLSWGDVLRRGMARMALPG